MPTIVKPEDLQALGFSAESFGAVVDFPGYLQAILDEQEALLTFRISAATVADSALNTLVALAEKSLSASELCQRRINRLMENINQDTPAMIDKIRKQQDKYIETAENTIKRLLSTPLSQDSSGFSVGVVESSSLGCS